MAPRFPVRKIFERNIAMFNVAGKSNWVGLLLILTYHIQHLTKANPIYFKYIKVYILVPETPFF